MSDSQPIRLKIVLQSPNAALAIADVGKAIEREGARIDSLTNKVANSIATKFATSAKASASAFEKEFARVMSRVDSRVSASIAKMGGYSGSVQRLRPAIAARLPSIIPYYSTPQVAPQPQGRLRTPAGGSTPAPGGRTPQLASGAGGRSFGAITCGASTAVKSIDATNFSVVKLAAQLYVLEQAGRLLKSVLVDPFVSVSSAIIEATEDSREFELAIRTVAGGATRAQGINAALAREARSLPISLNAAREASRVYAAIPSLSSRLAIGSPTAAARESIALAQTVRKLSAIDPAQGETGALTAIRELAEGGGAQSFQSIRRRFGFTAKQLAAAAGTDVERIAADPSLALKGVQNLTNLLISDQAVSAANGLISVRFQKIQDGFSEAASRIGNSGVFNETSARLEKMAKGIFGYLDSPAMARDAKLASAALDRIVGNLFAAGQRAMRAASGTSGDASTTAGVASSIVAVLDRIADATAGLPGLAERLGRAGSDVASRVVVFVDALNEIAAAAANPSSLGGRISNPATPLRKDDARISRVLKFVTEAGGDAGLVSSTYANPNGPSDSATAAADRAYVAAQKEGRGFFRSSFEALTTLASQSIRGGSPDITRVPDFSRLDPRLAAAAEGLNGDLLSGNDTSADRLARLRAARPSAVSNGQMPSELASFIRGTDGGDQPNYLILLQGLNSSLGGLSDLAGKQNDRLGELSETARSLLSRNLGSENEPLNVGDLFREIERQRVTYQDRATAAINSGQEALRQNPNRADAVDIRNNLRTVAEFASRNETAARIVSDQLADQLTESVSDYGTALAASISDLPPAARAILLDQVVNGSTDLAEKVGGILTAAGRTVDRAAMGLDSMPLAARIRIVADRNKALIDQQIDAAKTGIVTPGMSAGAIEESFRNRPTDDVARANAARVIRERAIPAQASVLEQANLSLAKNPLDPSAIASATNAAQGYADLLARAGELDVAADRVAENWRRAFESMRESLDSSLGRGISDMILGVGSLEDALRGFSQDVVQIFSDMAARNLVQGLVGNLGQTVTNSSGQQSTSGIGGFIGQIFGSLFSGGGITRAGSGGLFPNGIRRYGSGGLVGYGSSAELAIVGDRAQGMASSMASNPEAIVPLAGGGIPVRFSGPRAGGGAPTIVIVSDMQAAAREAAQAELRSGEGTAYIVSSIGADLARGGVTYKAMARKQR